MILTLNQDSFFIFDLDDTLYSEIQYLKSAYRFIAKKILPIIGADIYSEMLKRYKLQENVFKWIVTSYSHLDSRITVSYLLHLYREHQPIIALDKEARHLLKSLKERNVPVGLITDGRSTTQRNKLKALGLDKYFTEIIISEEFGSEKPDERNYLHFKNKYKGKKFYFVGDNTSKDFIVPLKLGWVTICLRDKGSNINPQNLKDGVLPDLIIDSFKELILL